MDDVKGLCERLWERSAALLSGEADSVKGLGPLDARLDSEAAIALQSLAKELAEARAAYVEAQSARNQNIAAALAAEAALAEVRAERDEARGLLGRCRTVLGNMAQENEGAIFNRWPIHHEPLRSDARNLLPLIDKEIGHEG